MALCNSATERMLVIIGVDADGDLVLLVPTASSASASYCRGSETRKWASSLPGTLLRFPAALWSSASSDLAASQYSARPPGAAEWWAEFPDD
jgi:hypothetical protein